MQVHEPLMQARCTALRLRRFDCGGVDQTTTLRLPMVLPNLCLTQRSLARAARAQWCG